MLQTAVKQKPCGLDNYLIINYNQGKIMQENNMIIKSHSKEASFYFWRKNTPPSTCSKKYTQETTLQKTT